MPVPWFLLSLALGRSPIVLSLERLVGPQDATHCSPVSLEPWGDGGRLRVQFLAQQSPSLAPVTAATARTALSGLSGADGRREEWGRGKSWVCLPLGGSGNTEPQKKGLSCHLWDSDILCLPGDIVPAPGPVLAPTHLQTELVLRCRKETYCDLCVRVAVHLAVHGHWEEPEDEEKFGGAADPGVEEPRNASLQAQVVLSFQAYPTTRCVLLEVQVPAALVQFGQSVGSVVYDCFEAALGSEVRIWSYTQPRYEKELNLTQQLPDCRGLEVRNSIPSCWALPWLNVSADGDNVHLVLNVSEEQHFGLSLYWNQVQGPPKPRWHKNLTGPQIITLNHTDLVPCLCIQVWPLEPDSVRTNICPFREDPRAHQNLWRAARLRLLTLQSWLLDAPCSLPAEAALCWQAPGGDPCQPLVPPLSWENVTVDKVLEFPLLKGHPNLCVQQVNSWEKLQLQECLWADSLGPLKDDVLLLETRGPQDNRSLCALEPSGCTSLPSKASTRAARLGEYLLQDLQSGQCLQLWDNDLGALWACSMDKYIHKRWALLWLACLLFAAALSLILLLKKDHAKGWLRLLKQDVRSGAAARGRAALLLYSADDSGFERLVGALASALCQLPLRVAVDLWSRREMSAQGPVAWFHAQRRQTLQEGGVVVLLFSPGAVALCSEWLQDGMSAPGAHGPHDAFRASLSCVLPDFLQGRAPGRYVGACFDRLLHPDSVPALFRTVPVFSLPSQLPDFLGALQQPRAPRPRRLQERAEHVSRALQPALDSYFHPPGTPAPGRGVGPGAGDGT
ncbi:interleukin-17 receptor C isoform X1 [Rhinopithecus roxellana]|uniref:interleukin-17 receptor C isoform X1 n=1 Tax=Rhinopithecus bieti TaxID=61621 RepID=UPI00083BC48D|nr:PREDICTED: interleukin-17 receptor C isoform X1 [Rhinopithecus bieti]XP_030783513.1 interleukin-17 receptor C isoform X1 [Rhinopithecus roxellana]